MTALSLPHLRRSCDSISAFSQPFRAGLTCAARPALERSRCEWLLAKSSLRGTVLRSEVATFEWLGRTFPMNLFPDFVSPTTLARRPCRHLEFALFRSAGGASEVSAGRKAWVRNAPGPSAVGATHIFVFGRGAAPTALTHDPTSAFRALPGWAKLCRASRAQTEPCEWPSGWSSFRPERTSLPRDSGKACHFRSSKAR